jgi:DNA-binding NtrC family response regulator
MNKDRMKKPFTILISDRNRYIREFLSREMKAEGYHVELAKNSKEVLQSVNNRESFKLLILDLDMPEGDGLDLLTKLRQSIPTMPVIVHSFLSDYEIPSDHQGFMEFVEKGGNSIDRLNKVVLTMLQKSHPQHFEACHKSRSIPNQ